MITHTITILSIFLCTRACAKHPEIPGLQEVCRLLGDDGVAGDEYDRNLLIGPDVLIQDQNVARSVPVHPVFDPQNLVVGSVVDVCSLTKPKVWRTCTVVEIKEEEIKVHYIRCGEKEDEWVPVNSKRLDLRKVEMWRDLIKNESEVVAHYPDLQGLKSERVSFCIVLTYIPDIKKNFVRVRYDDGNTALVHEDWFVSMSLAHCLSMTEHEIINILQHKETETIDPEPDLLELQGLPKSETAQLGSLGEQTVTVDGAGRSRHSSAAQTDQLELLDDKENQPRSTLSDLEKLCSATATPAAVAAAGEPETIDPPMKELQDLSKSEPENTHKRTNTKSVADDDESSKSSLSRYWPAAVCALLGTCIWWSN